MNQINYHTNKSVTPTYADEDTAVELMKKEEKMLVAELTAYYSQNTSYKNTSELNAHIYSDKRFKDFAERFGKPEKVGIVLKLDTKLTKLSERT